MEMVIALSTGGLRFGLSNTQCTGWQSQPVSSLAHPPSVPVAYHDWKPTSTPPFRETHQTVGCSELQQSEGRANLARSLFTLISLMLSPRDF